MKYSKDEILEFVRDNDVKFIRLAFCDIFGRQKNISIMATELEKAFTYGISFDASAVNGFLNIEDSDLFLFPVPDTMAFLPWRPSSGRVLRFYCDIKYPDGKPFEGDSREILKSAIRDIEQIGLECKIGTECEFYLMQTDDKGDPTMIPQDYATYLDLAPQDKGENVRREICLTLEEMGIKPESSHHEQGPGQNEIDFAYSNPLNAADNFTTFKSVVKTIAASNGLFASFMPKPFRHSSGSGLHTNLSLFKDENNLFRSGGEHSLTCESFIAGILKRAVEISVFLNSITNSYGRLGFMEAPKYISWSHQNRSQLIRIPAASGRFSRMELRSPDPCINPYIAYSLLIRAGLEGILESLSLPKPCNLNLFQASSEEIKAYHLLPENLGQAIEIAQNSKFIAGALPQKTILCFLDAKTKEWNSYLNAKDKDDFEKNYYFYVN